MSFKKIVPVVLALIMVLAGCGSRKQPLKPLKKRKADFSEKKGGIELRVKRLPDKLYSGVLQLFIVNKSEEIVEVNRRDISCWSFNEWQLTHCREKKSSLVQNGIAGAGILGVGFLLAYPFICGIGEMVMVCWPAALLALPFAAVYGGSVLVKSGRANKFKREYAFLRENLLHTLIVSPGSSATALLVMGKSSVYKPFTCNIHKGKEEIPFEVELKR